MNRYLVDYTRKVIYNNFLTTFSIIIFFNQTNDQIWSFQLLFQTLTKRKVIPVRLRSGKSFLCFRFFSELLMMNQQFGSNLQKWLHFKRIKIYLDVTQILKWGDKNWEYFLSESQDILKAAKSQKLFTFLTKPEQKDCPDWVSLNIGILSFYFSTYRNGYQNCSDLLREKIVLVIEKNFW